MIRVTRRGRHQAYLSTPLKTGLANISFTFKPNDNHGNWQIDDVYVDPWKVT